MNSQINLGVVVTTLGRTSELEKLLLSIIGDLQKEDCIVVVAQKNFESISQLCSKFQNEKVKILLTHSKIGASKGRNAGVNILPQSISHIIFPNDTCIFPEGTINHIKQIDKDTKLAALQVKDKNGPRFILPGNDTKLNKKNLWFVMEAGLLIQKSVFLELEGFNEKIGSGSGTPWQAGEASDLILRYLCNLNQTCCLWLPNDICVYTLSESSGLTNVERRIKIRAYGRGIGKLRAEWNYPFLSNIKFLLGGLFIGFLHHKTYKPFDGFYAFLGRLEGLLGIIVNQNNLSAVNR